MASEAHDQRMEAVKVAVARLFELASTEEEVCRLERAAHDEIAYLAALAQADRVKPPGGWDRHGR